MIKVGTVVDVGTILDTSMPDFDQDDKNIDIKGIPNSLFFVPVKDESDGGKVKVKVYSENPTRKRII